MTSDPLAATSIPTGSAVLRPSRTAYGRAVRGNIWVAWPLVVVSLIRVGQNWWLLPVLAGVLVVSAGCVLLYFRVARVEYEGGSHTVVSMFGTRRTFSDRAMPRS